MGQQSQGTVSDSQEHLVLSRRTRRDRRSYLPWPVPIFSLVGILFFIVVWWIVSARIGNTRLPSPWVTSKAFALSFLESNLLRTYGAGPGGVLPHIWYSVRVAALGTGMGVSAGVGLGLLIAWSRRLQLFLSPQIEFFRAVPPLAAVPFFLMWFGTGIGTQLGVIVFFSLLRLVIYTREAIRNIPPVYAQFAMTLGATRAQVFKTVIVPGIIPELIGAVRVTLATAWGIEVVAELMGSNMGVGKVFNILAMVLATPEIMALVLWLAAIAILADLVFTRLARRATRWLPS